MRALDVPAALRRTAPRPAHRAGRAGQRPRAPTPTSCAIGLAALEPAAATSGSCPATTSGASARRHGDGRDASRARRPRGARRRRTSPRAGCCEQGEAVCVLPRGRHLLLVHRPLADARRRRAGAGDRRPAGADWRCGAASGSPPSGVPVDGREPGDRPAPRATGRRPVRGADAGGARRRPRRGHPRPRRPAHHDARGAAAAAGAPAGARGSTRRGTPPTWAGTRPTAARRCCHDQRAAVRGPADVGAGARRSGR